MPRVTLMLPIEWAEAFDGGYHYHPERYCSFHEEGFRDFVQDRQDWRLDMYRGEIVTTVHDTPGYEGIELVCAEVTFLAPETGLRQRMPFSQPIARELRISVPTPTKLPLP